MKEILLSTLRNHSTSRSEFREAAERLTELLAMEASLLLEKEKISLQTPQGEANGIRFKNPQVLVPILRSGVAMLNGFLNFFDDARVGFVGMWRDETTKLPHKYYQKLPKITPNDEIMILDPMLATGGSATGVIDALKKAGANEEKMIFVGILAAPEGLKNIKTRFPALRIVVAHIDENLDPNKFIYPGLGDFGDRYFGKPMPTPQL